MKARVDFENRIMSAGLLRCHSIVAKVLQSLPSFRGKGKLAEFLHRRMLSGLTPSQAVRCVRMHDGSFMKVDLRSATEWTSYYTGRYDDQLASVLPLITKRCNVVDVGANIGFWTVPLAHRLQKLGGLCFAFEPVTANFERLQDNIVENGLENTIHAYAQALGEKNGAITMLLDSSGGALTGNAARVSHAAYDDGQRERSPVSAQVRRLDDVACEIGLDQRPCAFMKVDIEGSEPLFLRGATRSIQQHQPMILVEINRIWLRRNGLGLDDYFRVLCPRSFRIFLWRAPAWKEIAIPLDWGTLGDIETALFIPRSDPHVSAALTRLPFICCDQRK